MEVCIVLEIAYFHGNYFLFNISTLLVWVRVEDFAGCARVL
jgi:hypothetical protein